MDKIKGLFNSLTGDDGKLDTNDLKNVDINNLSAQAEELGLGDLTNKLQGLGIGNMDIAALGKLDFPLDKQEIISSLKSAGVSDQLVSLLDKVPDQVYESLLQLQDKLPI